MLRKRFVVSLSGYMGLWQSVCMGVCLCCSLLGGYVGQCWSLCGGVVVVFVYWCVGVVVVLFVWAGRVWC
jgi:hypothetical protein